MGYAVGMGPCLGCGTVFSFNPNIVPSTRDARGVKQPVCRPCMLYINQRRIEKDMDPVPIREGAYDPIEESEL